MTEDQHHRTELALSQWMLGVLCLLGFVGGATTAWNVKIGYWPTWAAWVGWVVTAVAWGASLVLAVEVAAARRAAARTEDRIRQIPRIVG